MVTRVNFIVQSVPKEEMDDGGIVYSDGKRLVLKSIGGEVIQLHDVVYITYSPTKNTLKGGIPWNW